MIALDFHRYILIYFPQYPLYTIMATLMRYRGMDFNYVYYEQKTRKRPCTQFSPEFSVIFNHEILYCWLVWLEINAWNDTVIKIMPFYILDYSLFVIDYHTKGPACRSGGVYDNSEKFQLIICNFLCFQ